MRFMDGTPSRRKCKELCLAMIRKFLGTQIKFLHILILKKKKNCIKSVNTYMLCQELDKNIQISITKSIVLTMTMLVFDDDENDQYDTNKMIADYDND